MSRSGKNVFTITMYLFMHTFSHLYYIYVCGCSVVVKKMFRFIREIVRGYLNFSSPISMNLSPSPKLLRGSVQVLVFCSKEFLLIFMYSNYCLKYRIYISRTVTFLVNLYCIIVARHLFSFVLMMNSLRLEINWSGKKIP